MDLLVGNQGKGTRRLRVPESTIPHSDKPKLQVHVSNSVIQTFFSLSPAPPQFSLSSSSQKWNFTVHFNIPKSSDIPIIPDKKFINQLLQALLLQFVHQNQSPQIPFPLPLCLVVLVPVSLLTTNIMGVSSWVREDERTWTQKLGANILKNGPIPRHVGFIMDGNRRYATKSSVPKLEGHIKGFEKLTETLRWCLDLGITEVTVYVFSIENFKRPQEEVDGLMKLATDKFKQLLDEKDKLMEEGVCVQIVGDWALVPPELKPLMAKAMILTRENSRAKLNVAFAYTARNEITRGVSDILEHGIGSGELLPEDLDEELLNKTFQILPSKPLDLLVRTSGETRLSDFLLWQSSESVLCFTKVLWPEFSYWHLLGAIFHYQLNYFSILQIKKGDCSSQICSNSKDLLTKSKSRQNIFIEKLVLKKWETLIQDSASISSPDSKHTSKKL